MAYDRHGQSVNKGKHTKLLNRLALSSIKFPPFFFVAGVWVLHFRGVLWLLQDIQSLGNIDKCFVVFVCFILITIMRRFCYHRHHKNNASNPIFQNTLIFVSLFFYSIILKIFITYGLFTRLLLILVPLLLANEIIHDLHFFIRYLHRRGRDEILSLTKNHEISERTNPSWPRQWVRIVICFLTIMVMVCIFYTFYYYIPEWSVYQYRFFIKPICLLIVILCHLVPGFLIGYFIYRSGAIIGLDHAYIIKKPTLASIDVVRVYSNWFGRLETEIVPNAIISSLKKKLFGTDITFCNSTPFADQMITFNTSNADAVKKAMYG